MFCGHRETGDRTWLRETVNGTEKGHVLDV